MYIKNHNIGKGRYPCERRKKKGSAHLKWRVRVKFSQPTFAQATAITILAPAFAMPFASALEPTYQDIIP